MRKVILKVYMDKIELRSYDVEKCIAKNENFEIIYDGDRMVLKPDELLTKRVSISPTFESKIGGKDYQLFGYVWQPQ